MWNLIALVLWIALAASLVLGVFGIARRSGALLLVAGLLSLGFCWAAMLSIGRLLVLIPLLELAFGVAYLARARGRTLYVAGGIAATLYVAQLAMLL